MCNVLASSTPVFNSFAKVNASLPPVALQSAAGCTGTTANGRASPSSSTTTTSRVGAARAPSGKCMCGDISLAATAAHYIHLPVAAEKLAFGSTLAVQNTSLASCQGGGTEQALAFDHAYTKTASCSSVVQHLAVAVTAAQHTHGTALRLEQTHCHPLPPPAPLIMPWPLSAGAGAAAPLCARPSASAPLSAGSRPGRGGPPAWCRSCCRPAPPPPAAAP